MSLFEGFESEETLRRPRMDLLPELNSTFWKAGRLKTFEHWPYKSSDRSCDPERMAAAGFLAIGGEEEPDLVECFICSKQLDGWDPDDDPWKEHVKHQPQCPYLILNKPDEGSWTVNDLFALLKKYTAGECTRELNEAVRKVKEETAKLVTEIPRVYKRSKKNLS